MVARRTDLGTAGRGAYYVSLEISAPSVSLAMNPAIRHMGTNAAALQDRPTTGSAH